MDIWTMGYFPFTMGGPVERPIKAEYMRRCSVLDILSEIFQEPIEVGFYEFVCDTPQTYSGTMIIKTQK